ncbi:MAG: hypothetical protein ABFD11_05740 [Christensenella sp.]
MKLNPIIVFQPFLREVILNRPGICLPESASQTFVIQYGIFAIQHDVAEFRNIPVTFKPKQIQAAFSIRYSRRVQRDQHILPAAPIAAFYLIPNIPGFCVTIITVVDLCGYSHRLKIDNAYLCYFLWDPGIRIINKLLVVFANIAVFLIGGIFFIDIAPFVWRPIENVSKFP